MRLFRQYLVAETARCVVNGVRLEIIGRRDRLGPGLLRAVEAAEIATRGGARLRLRVAIDYSGRDAILRAAQCLRPGSSSRESFGRLVSIVDHGSPGARAGPADPDRRRAAVERLPAVGSGLRRAALHLPHVARVRTRRASGGGGRIHYPGAALRRGARCRRRALETGKRLGSKV